MLATWCEELTHLKRPWCWERLKAGGEGDDRGWDGWMAPPIRGTWVWVSSGNGWWTGKPGVLQSTGLQRVGHDWVTELKAPRYKFPCGPKLCFPVGIFRGGNYSHMVTLGICRSCQTGDRRVHLYSSRPEGGGGRALAVVWPASSHDAWCCVLHVSTSHLSVFPGEASIQILCPFYH